MRKRLLSFIVGRRGLLRAAAMRVMFHLRRKWLPSRLLPDFRFIRTLQSPYHLVFDHLTGRYQFSSKAFTPGSDGTVSGDLEQLLLNDGIAPTAMFPAPVRNPVGAASLTVGEIRTEGANVEHDPVPSNWYHATLGGISDRRVRKRLSQMAVEIIPIDQKRADDFFKKVAAPKPGAEP